MIFPEEDNNDRAPLLPLEHQEARHSDQAGYDLDLLEIPDSAADESSAGRQREFSKQRRQMEIDDFVYFVTLNKWQDPSPWPSLAEVAESASFDPFGVDASSGDSNLQELPAETEDFFMPDPMVDPSGVTVDSFYLSSLEETTGIEFYPNRAVKLYYLTSSLPPDGIPESFLCPIGLEIMSDPVILPDGHSYDRAALIKWLQVNNTSPATRQVVSLDDIRPNWMLRNLIRQYNQKKDRKEQKLRQKYRLQRRQRRHRTPVAFSDDGISRLAI